MRIFLDVGAHIGQTLEEVTKPGWSFDRIYAFEPMPLEFKKLHDRFGGEWPRVHLLNYGLLNKGGIWPVYGANDGMEATVLSNMDTLRQPERVTLCDFIEAASFINLLPQESLIVMKLNCEGSEVAILDNLVDTRRIDRIFWTMIDFDIRHTPNGQDEIKRVLARLQDVGFNRYFLCDEVMIGPTHQERTAAWLRKIPWAVTGNGYM